MAAVISPEAQRLIDRLAAVNRASPTIDRSRVESALHAHLAALGLDPLPVLWTDDGPTAWLHVYGAARNAAESAARNAAESAAGSAARSAAWSAAWSAALSAAESAAWSAARSAAESAAIDRWVGIWLPFVDAYEAGLWLFWILPDAIVACPRPALSVVNDRLHCADGPAVAWPGGARFYFWHGVQVEEAVICRPETITVAQIQGQGNAEIRRVLLERYGFDRFVRESGAIPVHADDVGTLYRIELSDDEPLVMVHVLNSTPEPGQGDGLVQAPDGTWRRRYWLRVPPTIRTARAAVAWTFGRAPSKYAPQVET